METYTDIPCDIKNKDKINCQRDVILKQLEQANKDLETVRSENSPPIYERINRLENKLISIDACLSRLNTPNTPTSPANRTARNGVVSIRTLQ